MLSTKRLLYGVLLIAAAVVGPGCAGTASMTEAQKAAFELRRYCEQNPDDTVRCLGFLGDH